jgi:hypothetical protein
MSDTLNQLQSADPARRKNAVSALAKAKDVAALPSLEDLAHHDPDESIRQLAEKAARYIRRPLESEPSFLAYLPTDGIIPPPTSIERHAQRRAAKNALVADFSIFALVNIIGLIAISVLTFPRFATAIAPILQDSPGDSYTGIRYFLDGLSTATLDKLAVMGLICGIVAIPFIIVSTRLIHLVAVEVLGGEYDTFNNILQQTLQTQTLINLLSMLTFVVMSALNPINILVGLVIHGGLTAWFSRRLGEVYAFGIGKGFLAVIFTYAIYFTASFGIGFLFALR